MCGDNAGMATLSYRIPILSAPSLEISILEVQSSNHDYVTVYSDWCFLQFLQANTGIVVLSFPLFHINQNLVARFLASKLSVNVHRTMNLYFSVSPRLFHPYKTSRAERIFSKPLRRKSLARGVCPVKWIILSFRPPLSALLPGRPNSLAMWTHILNLNGKFGTHRNICFHVLII
jgi:hypothetical protein